MEKSANDLINKALDLGINYFDTATKEMYKTSQYYLGQSLGNRRKDVVIASKIRSRSYSGARKELNESFALLKTSYIDIIQLHTIENEKDKEVFGKNGAIKLLEEAKKSGKINHVGITGHYDPNILMEFMDEYNFDTLLISCNPSIPEYDEAIKKARSQDMGSISMKIMGRGLLLMKYPANKLLHYALARTDIAIIGCSTESDLERDILATTDFEENIDIDINIPESARPEFAFFSKKYEDKGKKWPSTYQPDWPRIQYDK
jgi:predicted aldo/keto reductase-like oxidoreductase